MQLVVLLGDPSHSAEADAPESHSRSPFPFRYATEVAAILGAHRAFWRLATRSRAGLRVVLFPDVSPAGPDEVNSVACYAKRLPIVDAGVARWHHALPLLSAFRCGLALPHP